MSQRTSIRRRLATWLVAALASAGAIFGLAAPASAAPQDYCDSGTACVWDDPSYNTNGNYGALLWFEFYVGNMSNYNYRGTSITAGNTADSWYNNGNSSTACFYDHAYYEPRSTRKCLERGTGDGNIANQAGLIQNVTWDPNSAKFI
ncbi:hypothetical protein [Microbacterium suaedae]|uniref:hypothetical protein n=1 Tax=Microbacterium suaedae TaxID=2067813 RepID=UPI000DA1F171|nr:hypothetical protein [Microbacterium suaedae]